MDATALSADMEDGLAGLAMRRNGVLWLGDGAPPELNHPLTALPPARLMAAAPPDAAYDAVLLQWEHPNGTGAAVVRAAQRTLRPGGRVIVLAARRDRHLRRLLDAHFDGGVPSDGKPFARVRATRGRAGLWLYHARRRDAAAAPHHFEVLAPQYGEEIPRHLAAHYRERKLQHILGYAKADQVVIDLGCGTGSYAAEVQRRSGARVIALDASPASLRVARGVPVAPTPRPMHVAASALRLPVAPDSIDLVYTINMLHHLKRGEQELAVEEIHRALKPGGRLIVAEMNLRNPLFAFYMRHVFPRTRDIDRGDEEFLADDAWPLVTGYRLEALHHHTFTPDFLPRPLLRTARRIEALLERSPLRTHAVHYTAILRKTGNGK